MFLGVTGATQHHTEPVRHLGPSGGIWRRPVFLRLPVDRLNHRLNRRVEVRQQLLFRLARTSELLVTVSNVARLGDLRPNVLVQVSSEVEDQVADAIAVGVWPSPEFMRRERL